MADKIILAELDIDSEALLKNTSEIKKQIDALKKAQAELRKAGDTSSKQYVQNASDLKVLSKAYNQNIKAISENTQAVSDLANREKLLTQVLNQEVTSIKEAREQNKLLNKLRNETNVTTKEGQEQIKQLNAKLDSNNELIKENADAYLKQKINIGNYEGAINKLSPQLGAIISQLKGIAAGLMAQREALIATTTATSGTSKALKVFRLALISTGIGAIVVILGSLVSFLTSTQEGIDKVTSVTRPLQAIFQSLIGVLQNVGKFLFDAFSNPKQLLIDLANFIKTNIINRFKAFAVILEGIINFDFKKIADGVGQAATGVENLTDKISNAAKATGEFLNEAVQKGKEIDRLTKEIENKEINLNKERQKGLTQIKELDRIAKDTSANIEDRIKANEEQNRIAQEQAQQEIEILELKRERLKVQQSLNDTSREELKELADLEAQIEQVKQKAIDEELRGIRVVAQARKEQEAKRLAAIKKAQDEALRQQENELKLFQERQGFAKKTAEEELRIAEETASKDLAIQRTKLEQKKINEIEFAIESERIQNELLEKRTNLIVQNAERELNAFIEANASKIDSQKFFTELALQEEQRRIDLIVEKEQQYQALRLERGIINEKEYQDALTSIQKNAENRRQEAENLRSQAEQERKQIDLENRRELEDLIFEEDFAIRANRLELQRVQEVEAAEKTGADIDLINKKYAVLSAQLDQQKALAKVQNEQNAVGKIGKLAETFFGENKSLNIALATADAFLAVQKAYLSQLIPGDPTSLPRAIGAGIQAGVFGAANVAKVAGVKFEKGGIQEVGGKRHSEGGTKFYGSDGSMFEAEKGEGIGILNRRAFGAFLGFNNLFNYGRSSQGFFQGGGIITQSVPTQTNNNADFIEALKSMPRPVVAVEDINTGQNQFVEIIQGANLG